MAIKRRVRPFCPYKIPRHNMSFSLLIKPFPDNLNPLFLRVLRVRRILRILRVLRVATDAAETPNRLQPSVHGWGPDRWRTWTRTWCRTWSRAWSPAWSWTWSTVHLDAATLLYMLRCYNFGVLLRLCFSMLLCLSDFFDTADDSVFCVYPAASVTWWDCFYVPGRSWLFL